MGNPEENAEKFPKQISAGTAVAFLEQFQQQFLEKIIGFLVGILRAFTGRNFRSNLWKNLWRNPIKIFYKLIPEEPMDKSLDEA